MRLDSRAVRGSILAPMPVTKIAIDYRCALLSHGGIARATRELVKALAARGDVAVHLYGHSLARAARVTAPPANTSLHRLPIPSRALPALKRLGIGPEDLCGKAELFHFTDYVYPGLVHARALVTVHDVAFARDHSFHGERMSKVLLDRTRAATRSARLVVVPTEVTLHDVEEFLLVPRERIRVVPFGADHVTAARCGATSATRPRFVMLGTIEPRKNHDRTLAALRSLPAGTRPELVVIGHVGWECDATVRALRSAASEGLVRWIRDADDQTLERELSSAHALVYPSHFEGFGFPPLEAMRRGLPVLAGDTPALREVLGDGALWCDPCSTESIAHGMTRLSTDSELRLQLAERGADQAARFLWATCAQGYAEAYREALA